ncbi:MAG: PAS domain S-box protein [Lachnospiraceae bacterium]|nr:PAS domain S-box protein [Lachnospiraceae bacterium]
MKNRATKILAIDNNQDNLTIVKAQINKAFPEIAVVCALNGQTGLEIAAKEEPQVILLNILMQGIDEYEVCRKLKSDKKLCDIPVVFITASNCNAESRHMALECGADAFLTKPIDESELIAQIRAMLKIRAAGIRKRDKKPLLTARIGKKTRELKDSNAELLKLVEAVKREQTLIQSIFDSIPGYLYVYNESERLIKWNKQHETMTGYTAAELSNMTLEKWFDQEDLIKVNAAVHDVFEKGYGEVEAQLILKSGEKMIIRSNGVPLILDGQKYFIGIGVDISERKKNEYDLKKSEERFQLLFNNAPLGYQSLDFEGCLIDVNQKWLDTFGFSKAEVIGKWFGDFLCPEYVDGFRQRFPLFKAQGYIHSEFELLSKDGQRLTISFDGKIAYGADGEFKQTHCILQDITKQRKAEKALIESEEKHRLFYETMTQGVVYYSFDGSIISANPAAERILGLKYSKNAGGMVEISHLSTIREDGSLLPTEDHPSIVALRTGEQVGPFVMGVFHENKYFWLSVTATPMFKPGEAKPYQAFVIMSDITAERKAHQNYELLFKEMVNGFALHEIICDDQGAPIDYRYLAVNPAFEEMTGLKSKDIVGKTVLELMPDTESYWIEKYGKVALAGEAVHFNNYSAAFDKYFEVTAYRPAPKQFACTFSDVTKRINAELDTKKVYSRLQALLDNSPAPIEIVDETGRYVEVSAAAASAIGLPISEVRGKHFAEFLSSDTADIFIKTFEQIKSTRMPMRKTDSVEIRGENRTFERWVFPIETIENHADLYGCITIDITERTKAEEALIKSEKKYRSYIDNTPVGVFVVNEQGKYLEVNKAACEITGYTESELLHMTIFDIAANESLATATNHFETLQMNGFMDGVLQFKHKNGSTRWWSVDAVKLSDTQFLGFSRDLTEQKQLEKELTQLSYHDQLTGLYNRRYFEEALVKLDTEKSLPLSIIMADVNGLKIINDSFGHAKGDELLIKVASTLNKELCSTGLVARQGGDEFVIVLPNTDETKADQTVNRLQRLISNERVESISISVSFGYETKNDIGASINDILIQAENHMYRHKVYESSSSHNKAIDIIIKTLFEKSNREMHHSERVSELCEAIAKEMHLDKDRIDRVRVAGLVHDIGKISISELILNKAQRLNDDEWNEMKKHPESGWRILMSANDFAELADFVLAHHERWDGKGYPKGLKDKEIPKESRIIAIADSYDAMTSLRPYRNPLNKDEAIEELRRCAGTQFDPDIVGVFIDKVLQNKPKPLIDKS